MQVRSGRGPTYGELRPLRNEAAGPGFPVHADLVDRMISAPDPDDVVRHVLATCAGYAYSDQATLAMIMTRLGLERSHCVQVTEIVDAMFICSTGFVVQSSDGRLVILCYRGTEPANFVSWLTDIDVNPDVVRYDLDGRTGEEDYFVHAGFYRNVRATRYAIVELLDRARRGRCITDGAEQLAPMEALYVTGHSLGGAMAALMTVMLRAKTSYEPLTARLKATYTYGQPMIGTADLARACSTARFGREAPPLRDLVFRYVYGDDVVPQLPPKESGSFGHFGLEFRCRPRPNEVRRPAWHQQRKPSGQAGLLGLALSGLPLITQQTTLLRAIPFRSSLADHTPHHYVDALTPPGVRSEFGD